MARIIILSTCDEWKSCASFLLYGTWASTKAGCKRLYKTILKGIKDGTFAYKDESMLREEQIMTFKEDEKRECATSFFSRLAGQTYIRTCRAVRA